MELRALHFRPDRSVALLQSPVDTAEIDSEIEVGWVWFDIEAGPGDIEALTTIADDLGLDPLAIRDAIEDVDLPKVDDFGTTMLVILHALAEGRVETYELDCFLTQRHLVTIRGQFSPSVEALWDGVQRRHELASGGADEILGRLADVVTRRLRTVLDVFDSRAEELVSLALRTDPLFLGEVTAVRSDLARLRRVLQPQRETLDELRNSSSALLTDSSRRRFSDVFDIASRASQEADGARAALAETLDAYSGAEARQATEVTKVLTVYAAIMLPLSLVAGFFGMNFSNLPLVERDWGWIVVTGFMALIAILSLGVFISLGWTTRPSGRSAGAVLGRGLVEAAHAPAQLVGAVFEISAMPVRSVASSRKPRSGRTSPRGGPA